MIPTFPSFKKLAIDDKKQIESITSVFSPYSDFNFTSLWSYNVADDIIISTLYGNLIVRFRDYVTNEPFFSFIGVNNIPGTISALFYYAEKTHVQPVLKLVPIDNFQKHHLMSGRYELKEDPDNFDYIYSTAELSALTGSKFDKKRNQINRFKKDYAEIVPVLLDVISKHIQEELFALFQTWEDNKHKARSETEHELTAMKRLLSHVRHFHIITPALRHQNNLIAFSLVEITREGHGMFHFTKVNTGFRGAYTMLYHCVAKELYSRGCLQVNREQDLGIEGLRIAKKGWNPVRYLKKYIIYPKNYDIK